MSKQWYYTKDKERLGPLNESEMKGLIQSGQVRLSDQVWCYGMASWAKAGSVPELVPPTTGGPPPMANGSGGPPPVPPVSPSFKMPALSGLPANKLLWAYRGLLGIAIIATLLPWISVSSSASMRFGDAARDIRGAGLGGFGSPEMDRMSNQSTSIQVSVSGASTIWGDFGLLVAMAGIALSFIGPNKLLADKDKIAMASIGIAILLFSLIVFFGANGYVNTAANHASQYADVTAKASFGIGMYLSLLAGLAAAILGYRIDWRSSEGLGSRST